MSQIFCSYCGTPITVAPTSDTAICPACGKAIRLTQGFHPHTSQAQPFSGQEAPAQPVPTQIPPTPSEGNQQNLLMRGKLFLEEGNWAAAREYFNRVLDTNAMNAEAYFGLFLAGGQYKDEASLLQRPLIPPTQAQPRLLWACQPDEAFIRSTVAPLAVKNYLTEQQLRAQFNYDLRYPSYASAAAGQLEAARKYLADNRFYAQARRFASPEYLQHLNTLEEQLLAPARQLVSKAAAEAEAAKEKVLAGYRDHLQRQADTVGQMHDAALQARETDYASACSMMGQGLSPQNAGTVIGLLQKVGAYQDAEQRLAQCRQTISEANLASQQQAEIQQQKKKEDRKKLAVRLRKLAILLVILSALGVGGYFLTTKLLIPLANYNKATALFKDGEYEQAMRIFRDLDDFKDSSAQVRSCRDAIAERVYADAVSYIEKGDYATGISRLKELDQDKAEAKLEDVYREVMDKAVEYASAHRSDEAMELLLLVPSEKLDKDTATYVEVLSTNFDDGELHDLAQLYKKVVEMQNDSWKQDLRKLPQFRTVELLNGTFYQYGTYGKSSSIHRSFQDGFETELSFYRLYYLKGDYYYYYSDEGNFHRMENISSTGFWDRCYQDGEQFWYWEFRK